MIHKKIIIRSPGIQWKLITNHPMTEQEILDVKTDLPMFDIEIIDFDMKQYTARSQARIDLEGDYIGFSDIRQELYSMGYNITDNDYILDNNIKIIKYNYQGHWIKLSKKLTEYPEAVIWSFPEYFTVWMNGYYTKVKDIRKQCLTGVYTIDITNWNKGK